jgi:hypothetical protein
VSGLLAQPKQGMGKMGNAYIILVGKSKEKYHLRGRTWDVIETDLRKIYL